MGKKQKELAVDGESDFDKPLPDPTLLRRPGTSGTEMGLRTERRKASSAYVRAQRAEQAYRAKKQAGTARTNMSAANLHYRAAWKSIKIGTIFFMSAVWALPGLLGEKRADRMEKKEGVRREKTIKKRRKLEDEMKRHELQDGIGTVV